MTSRAAAKTPDRIRKQGASACGFRRQSIGSGRRRIRRNDWIGHAIQPRDVSNDRRQFRSRKRIREGLHGRVRNSSHHRISDECLIEAAGAESGRAAACALRAVAVSISAGFVEHFFALLQDVRKILRGRDGGQEEQKEESLHFTPSGSANTTSVEPRRKFSLGNNAAAAPPTIV